MASAPRRKHLFSVRMRASRGSEHISGAEGIHEEKDIPLMARKYACRALNHPKGKPDEVIISIERLAVKPAIISSLPVKTFQAKGRLGAQRKAQEILRSLGVSGKAAAAAWRVIARGGMRGAALISAVSGKRLDPDRKRGVRASMLGIEERASRELGRRLALRGINHFRVREALVLASKAARAPGVIAELCVSDDPDYTTGYVASGKLGYMRLPNIKGQGSAAGGRALFVREGASAERVIEYLEKTPVMVGKISSVGGIILPDGKAGGHRRKPGGKKVLP